MMKAGKFINHSFLKHLIGVAKYLYFICKGLDQSESYNDYLNDDSQLKITHNHKKSAIDY